VPQAPNETPLTVDVDLVRISLVVPIYRNEQNIPDLLVALERMASRLPGFEAVLVVDGSPDRSEALLREALPQVRFRSQLLSLSRNFGSFAAIREGLRAARGRFFAVMAADLQEPPELAEEFFRRLAADECDVAVGVRRSRGDQAWVRLTSAVYWSLYRRFVMREVPAGGVDMFGCNLRFRDELLQLNEQAAFLIGQIFWLGFRRIEVPYDRLPRAKGESGWPLRRRLRYLVDSIFAHSDLPIQLLVLLGGFGTVLSLLAAVVVAIAWLAGGIAVQGYVPIMLALLFVGFVIILSLGIVGIYVWRIAENVRQRPLAVVARQEPFGPIA
jgi:glycosyltransferase involved in cell wall biosynthesis